jgi:carbamoyltransferase
MHILGLSCFYHDAASCLISDGKVIAAAQEERFSGVKHDWRFPKNAIRYCIEEAGLRIEDIGLVVFYEKPFIKFERMLQTFIYTAPRGCKAFLDTVPSWLKQKLWLPVVIKKELGYTGKVLFAEHHMSHAASAFFTSPYDEAAILTVDGVGEWATASYGYGRGGAIKLTHEMKFPNSLGLLYSAITSYLGFTVNDSEYKVMGMAPYGKPRYLDLMLDNLVSLGDDGSLRLDLRYFSFQYGRRMFNGKLEGLFGVQKRAPGSPIDERHFDIAASLQRVTEEAMLSMARHVHRETGVIKNLCLAGGVSLNCVANGRLLKEGPFENIFIQPAAGDAGGAMGAAYLGYHHYLRNNERHPLETLYLGPSFEKSGIRSYLEKEGIACREMEEEELVEETALMLSMGKVMGWFQGRMEFGPRALGNRSILADPRSPGMKDLLNRKVKFREEFRPFAPVVTEEDSTRYFDMDRPSPFMLITVPVKSGPIPAVTHVDGTARVQTLKNGDNPRLYRLLKEFEKLTGVPVLLNTSLNVKGDPIARTPADAIKCFSRSGMDGLVLGDFLLLK